MEILSVTTSYPIDEDNNSGIFVQHLINELNTTENVKVITPAYKEISGNISNSPEVFAFPYAPKKFQTLCHAPGGIPATLARNKWFILVIPFLLLSLFFNILIHSRGKDIIQANWAICGAIAGITTLFTRKKLFTTLRGDDVNNAEKSKINYLFLKLAIQRSQAIITVSEALNTELTNKFNIEKSKIITIPNGVSEDFISLGKQKTSANKEEGLINLIIIGSLIPRKNVAIAIQTLQELPNNVHLQIVGDGSEKNRLRKLTEKLALTQRVHFLGKCAHKRIPLLLHNSSILLSCSLSEGRSNSIYEAMAAGKPIIASNIPGTNEQIIHNKTGLLFDIDSSPQLTELIKSLIADPELATKLGNNAHKWIKDNDLTWQAAKTSYLKIFQGELV